ncbi:MAG: hypothetical protein HY619_03380, partial [Thaumarchaeota archaeon]|nr:hypothetical protein [Nitrososphaerota archaeon]
YDAEVYGAPVFMSGEPLWLYTLEPSRANLLDPRGRVIASVLVDRRPTPIYTFSSADPPGRWTLEVRGQDFSSSYLVRLQKRFLDQVDLENSFELENQSLISRGTVRILSDETLEPHNLVLVRHPPAFFLRELHGGVLKGSVFQIRMTQAAERPDRVAFAPYIPDLGEDEEGFPSLSTPVSSDVSAVFWVEASIDMPFYKTQADRTTIITVTGIITRTPTSRLFLTNSSQDRMEITLPSLGKVGTGGTMPLRFGKGSIQVYTQTEDSIFITKIPVYYLPQGLVVAIADEFSSPAITSSFDYVLRDNVTEASEYRLYLLTKVNGAQLMWNSSAIPPVARITVFNNLTQSPLSGYQMTLNSETGSHVTVEGDTYVLLSKNQETVRIGLSVNGVSFRGAVSPQVLTISPLSSQIVNVAAGRIEFRVKDILGIPIDTGTIQVYRRSGLTEAFETEVHWSEGIMPGMTMPRGSYAVTVSSLGATATSLFFVDSPERVVDISVNRLQVTLEQAMMSAAVTIIALEVLFAYKIWTRFFRMRNALSI